MPLLSSCQDSVLGVWQSAAAAFLQVAWNQVELAGTDLDEETRERLFAGETSRTASRLQLIMAAATWLHSA